MSSNNIQQAGQNTSQTVHTTQNPPQIPIHPAIPPSQPEWNARTNYLASIGYTHSNNTALSRMTKFDWMEQCIRLQDFIFQQQNSLVQQQTTITREREINDARGRREQLLRQRIEAREEELSRGVDLVEWGLEQQEGVLVEACERGVELAGAVIEQRILRESGMVKIESQEDGGEVAGGSEHAS